MAYAYSKYDDYSDLLNRMKTPKEYWIDKYKNGPFLYQRKVMGPYTSDPITYESGYDVLKYYSTLSNDMIPEMTNIFSKAYAQIYNIGYSNIFSKDGKMIKDMFTSYKELETFFNDNVFGSGDPDPAGSAIILNDNCLETMTINDDVIISNYNAEQESRDDESYSRAEQAKPASYYEEDGSAVVSYTYQIKDYAVNETLLDL